jgi:hypothetical protein
VSTGPAEADEAVEAAEPIGVFLLDDHEGLELGGSSPESLAALESLA